MLAMNTRKPSNRKNDSKSKPVKGRNTTKGRSTDKKDGKLKDTKSSSSKSKELKPKDLKARGRFIDYKTKLKKGDPLPTFNDDAIRLNKYLSNAGICSRRDADVLISTGVVSVNGEIILEMGYKVKPGDVVKYDGGTLKSEKKRYVLLNKPKGFVTTMDDPLGRKTVMGLVKKACRERVYPVGRLDRETTGLLLFTNDGDLAKKLTHPLHKAEKVYHVELNKKVSIEDLKKLMTGIDLEDGKAIFDNAEFVNETDAKEVGVELHSGKNRIVRRAFESLGYTVKKLDRVSFAGLTKKDLPRGAYRLLSEKEVAFLKMLKNEKS